MKHSTNYFNTLIEIAEDCPVSQAEVPPLKGDKKSVANLQFEMLIDNPYRYTSDEVFFAVHALRKGISKSDFEAEKALFFSKGQPCFRASPLAKRYGWGVHSNAEGKVALHGMDAETYANLVQDETVVKKKAMRSKRK